jgi:hypothetical protein
LRAGPAFETEEDHHEIPSTDIRIHFEEQGYDELTLGFSTIAAARRALGVE